MLHKMEHYTPSTGKQKPKIVIMTCYKYCIAGTVLQFVGLCFVLFQKSALNKWFAHFSPDKLVKGGSAIGRLGQNQSTVVATEQQFLKHITLQAEDQTVGLDHFHLICVDGVHPQTDITAVAHGQEVLHSMHQTHGVIQNCGTAIQCLLLQGSCVKRKKRMMRNLVRSPNIRKGP